MKREMTIRPVNTVHIIFQNSIDLPLYEKYTHANGGYTVTVETRTMIELKDILGIEIECTNCKHRCTVPIKSFYGHLGACPNCNSPWVALRDDFEKLAKALNTLHTFSNSKQDSINVHLEVTTPNSGKLELIKST
jgi:hypothetical protein